MKNRIETAKKLMALASKLSKTAAFSRSAAGAGSGLDFTGEIEEIMEQLTGADYSLESIVKTLKSSKYKKMYGTKVAAYVEKVEKVIKHLKYCEKKIGKFADIIEKVEEKFYNED